MVIGQLTWKYLVQYELDSYMYHHHHEIKKVSGKGNEGALSSQGQESLGPVMLPVLVVTHHRQLLGKAKTLPRQETSHTIKNFSLNYLYLLCY